jgi:hypothetical protein
MDAPVDSIGDHEKEACRDRESSEADRKCEAEAWRAPDLRLRAAPHAPEVWHERPLRPLVHDCELDG